MFKHFFVLLFAVSLVLGLNVHAQTFQPTDESLKQYQVPDWFRDAKFGIWTVWGPMAVPRQGDWYAKRMYNEKDGAYKYHLQHYGHPSEFGYKDIIPLWKAEKWNPDEMMKLFKRAGAKYFCSIATHHDNFFLWDSKLHRWNAVQMGPKKDIIGLWQQAAKKEGLYFGVTEHLGASYTWFQIAHGADTNGEKKGVPYDGANAEFYDLYHEPTQPGDKDWLTNNPKNQQKWYDRIKELIDQYHPDLLYSDSGMPFGNNIGRTLIADYYNQAQKYNKDGVVYNCKQSSDGKWVRDFERGVAKDIQQEPWQIDTSIGDWIYRMNDKYQTGTDIVQMLVDTVSKNGNLLLCIPPTPEGELDEKQTKALNDIGDWIAINGEAIYSTRPWNVYGEGPSMKEEQEKAPFAHSDGIKDFRKYKPGDLRFTQKKNTVYVFCMEPPVEDIRITSLNVSKITLIKMLGSEEPVKWTQNQEALTITKPTKLPGEKPLVFRVEQ